MELITEYKVLDMSVLYRLPNILQADNKVELKMIEFYKYYPNEENNAFVLFTKHFLRVLYKDNIDHDVTDIYKFYTASAYNSAVMSYLNKLDLILTLKLKLSNFVNIEFDSIVYKDENKLDIKFKVTRYE